MHPKSIVFILQTQLSADLSIVGSWKISISDAPTNVGRDKIG